MTTGEKITVRCFECFERIVVGPGANKVTCPSCQKEWLIYWPLPNFAKIKGTA